jgi:hypothetical protein
MRTAVFSTTVVGDAGHLLCTDDNSFQAFHFLLAFLCFATTWGICFSFKAYSNDLDLTHKNHAPSTVAHLLSIWRRTLELVALQAGRNYCRRGLFLLLFSGSDGWSTVWSWIDTLNDEMPWQEPKRRTQLNR